jgi:autotransporter-associated beta strand protein
MEIDLQKLLHFSKKQNTHLLGMTAALLAFSSPLAAQTTYTWDAGGTNTSWGNATNWVGDVVPTFNTNAILVFNTNVGTADTLFLGADRQFRSIIFGSSLTGGGDNVFDIRNSTALGSGTANMLFNGGAGNASITVENSALVRIRIGQNNTGVTAFQTDTDLDHNSAGTVFQFDGAVTGAGALNKRGVGTVTFTRANSYNGLNLYGGGAVVWNTATALGTNSVTLGETGSSSNVSLFFGSGLNYTNAITVSSGSGTRLIGNTDVTNQFGFAGITGNATNSGGINLAAGKDVTFAITNYNATTDRLTVSGAITGTGGVIKTGSGFLLLSGSNTYSGDTVLDGGNIQTAASNSFSSASVLKFGATTNSRRLQLQGNSQTLGGVDSTAATGGTLIVESAADNVSNSPATLTLDVAAGRSYDFSGYVRNAAGTATNSALTLVKNGAGTQMLSGSSGWVNYSGTTTINGGVLEFSGANSVAGNSAITLGGGTVRFSGGGTRSNTISGTGNLEKTGANTLVLAGTNSYAGTTRVLGGTLLITGDSSAATGSLMVSPGATFGGSGQFGGEVWFDVGARLPLTSGATLTLAPAGQVSFAGLNPIDISGLGLATAAGTYRLVDGTVSPSAIAALGEANAVHYGLRSKAWFELTNGLVLRVVEKSLTLPEVFPINMGFKTLLSTTNDPNNLFDTLANAGRYAIHHGNVSNVDQIKQAFPQVMTIAMNPRQTDGENRSQNVGDTNTGNVWPGFFLYRAGSRLISDIDASVTQIPVEDASRFTTRDYAVLSSLNAQGRPEFLTSAATGSGASYEIVNVTGVDTNSNTLTVVRGQTGTTTKAFAAGASAALPFREAWQIDNKITIIRPNFSLNAPRHPVTGENGAELWGRGRGLAVRDGLNDGTEQDIVSCLAGDRVDTDLNLVPDGGFADGINVWSLGWQEHVAIVRGIIGPNRILQHDCTRPSTGYRGWRYVNGIQIEAFGKGQDFSENFDLLAQWVQYADVQPAFSYGYCREPTTTYGGVQPDNDWLFRKQFAAGLMVGMPHPYGSGENFGLFDWDEQRGGELDDYAWLGRALGPFERDFSGMGTTDLLAGGSWSVVTAAGFAATHSGSPSDPEGIEIHVNQIPPLLQGDPVYSGVMLKWNSAALDLQRGAEYTLVLEARASDSITYNGKTYDGLPGLVRVRDFDGTIARFNFLVPGGWRTYYMSYVVPESGGNARFNGSFQLGEEAQRTFRLRNIRLYTGTADRLKREFENGVVLLNESQVTPWTATLGSGQHRRLKGNIRPDINTGATVTGSVNVPARDAVYLLKPTYANWAKERGLDMASGTGAGMSDDPDADGIPNLMEWVLAGHPLTRNTARPAVFRMENGALVFQFERTLQSKEAVACHVEHTTELQSSAPWTRIPVDGPSPPGVTITRVDLGDGTERIRVALAPSASAPRLFVRLVAVAGP